MYKYYIGVRRARDATLVYFEAEKWNGLFGAQASDQGPGHRRPKKEKKKSKAKKGDGEEAEKDEWGNEWELPETEHQRDVGRRMRRSLSSFPGWGLCADSS